jgi:hypothetical protein
MSTFFPMGALVSLTSTAGAITFDVGRASGPQPITWSARPAYAPIASSSQQLDLNSTVPAPIDAQEMCWQVIFACASGSSDTARVQTATTTLFSMMMNGQNVTIVCNLLGLSAGTVSNSVCRLVQIDLVDPVAAYGKFNIYAHCFGSWS